MKNVPYWIDSAPIRRFPRPQKIVGFDVLVIGTGVTGISTAYLLNKAGLSVTPYDYLRVDPCHSSLFKPTGDVIARPAEEYRAPT